MSIFQDFARALNDVFCSNQDAENMANDMIIHKLYENVNIERFGIVVDEIRSGKKAVSMIEEAVYNALAFTDGDSCDIEECDLNVDYDARTWEIAEAECRYPVCMKNASEKFMAFYGRYKMLRPDDSEYDFILERMTDLLSGILANSLLAKIFLADKSLTNEGALNGINGLLAQWEADASRVLDLSEFYDAGAIDGEGIYKAIKHISRRYRRDPYTKSTFSDAIIIMDDEKAEDLVDWLNDLGDMAPGDCTCYSADAIVRKDAFTKEGLTIAGIKIETIPYNEMSLQFPSLVIDEADNPNDGKVSRDFFIAMTVKENNQIGTSERSELSVSDYFHDKTTRKFNFDVGYRFGVLVTTPVYLYGVHYLE